MAHKHAVVIGLSLATATVSGCAIVSELLSTLSQIDLLGIIPSEDFSNPNSPDYGKVRLSLGGRDDIGIPVGPAGDDIEIVSDDGGDVTEGPSENIDGADLGSFLLLVDGSGSVEFDLTCDGCPTDTGRLRVEAARALAEELGACSGDWRMSLMEFGDEVASPGMDVTTVVADWTTDDASVADAADQLSSYFGTPLWDSVHESLTALDTDALDNFDATIDAGRGIVVLSDGADNASSHSLEDVIAHAQALGLAVHTVGFGPASDSADAPDNTAVQGLQDLADQTGGYYGFVQSVDDLPALTQAIAGAACGGYTELEATFEEPAPAGDTVTGLVRLKSAPMIAVPFSFRAPER